MRRILILLLIIFPLKFLATDIEIIADVNGEPISNLDIEKRVKLITSLFGNQNIDQREVESQMLKQLIDEIVIINESQRLNIKISNEELNNAVVSFFTQNFGLKAEEVSQYIKKHDIDLKVLTKQIKYQLLQNKIIEVRIIPFINGVSDEEVNNAKRQIEKSDYLVVLKEIIVPDQKTAEDLVKKLHDNSDFTPEPPIKVRETTVSLNQLKGKLKGILEKLEVGGITSSNEGYYSIIKVIDKVKLDYRLLNSTLSLKQTIVEDSEGILENFKKQKVDCLSFNKLINDLKLPSIKEFKIKMRDLNPKLQILFSKTNINEIVKIKEGKSARLIMLCNVDIDAIDIEAIKQKIYQQKVMTQSNLLFDDIRKNAIVNYHRQNSARKG